MDNEIAVNKKKLNSYKLKLTTLSPVHIGTGDVYVPTNFIIDNNRLYQFDEVLFYKSLNSADRKEFDRKLQDYMQIISFYNSRKERAKRIARFECEVSRRVQAQYDKKINKDGSRNRNRLEIQTTFKNPNTHRAIIPGSSLKGMFDTVFKIYPGKVKKNSVRQNLIVSDASLLNGGVEIGYADRKHRDPRKRSKGGIYQIVEVVKPQSEFVLSVDTRYSFSDIQEMMKRYHSERRDSGYQETKNSFMARVGKNSGKDYVVDDGKNVMNNDGKPLATHFLYSSDTLYDKQFGWIKLELISDDEYQKSVRSVRKQEKEYYQKIEDKQKEIKEQIQKVKDEAKALALKKQQEQEQEAKAETEAKAKREAELAAMSPLQRRLQKRQEAEPNTPKITLLKKMIENIEIEVYCEAVKLLQSMMQEDGKWKEKSAKKNPSKDKEYQLTLKVTAWLGRCR